MVPLKNWDNKTWLSSTKYINSFNNFILKQKKLNKNSYFRHWLWKRKNYIQSINQLKKI